MNRQVVYWWQQQCSKNPMVWCQGKRCKLARKLVRYRFHWMLFILKSHVSHHCHHTSSASSIYILSTSSEISPLYDLAALQHLAALLLRFKTLHQRIWSRRIASGSRLGQRGKKCSRTPFSTQSSSHQKLCIIFVIFLKYVNSKHVKTHSRLKLTRSLHLSVPGSFSSFHPISIRCTNLSCSTRQLCSCTIHLTFAAEDPPVSELVPLKSSLPPWPHESVAGRHQIGGFVAKPNIEAHNM